MNSVRPLIDWTKYFLFSFPQYYITRLFWSSIFTCRAFEVVLISAAAQGAGDKAGTKWVDFILTENLFPCIFRTQDEVWKRTFWTPGPFGCPNEESSSKYVWSALILNSCCRVCVKMKNLVNENVWLWERGKFTNRRFLMQVGTNKNDACALVHIIILLFSNNIANNKTAMQGLKS